MDYNYTPKFWKGLYEDLMNLHKSGYEMHNNLSKLFDDLYAQFAEKRPLTQY